VPAADLEALGIPNRRRAVPASVEMDSSAARHAAPMARAVPLRAHNEGRGVFYRQVGVTMIQWLTACDERTCPVCRPLDGKVFNIDEIPKHHSQCRCTWTSVP